jgi:hypothetical protein
MKRLGIGSIFLLVGLNACVSTKPPREYVPSVVPAVEIRFEPERSLLDESVLAEKMGTRNYNRIMVVPPSGTAGASFDRGLSYAERALMRLGIELISPAVGGRAIASGADVPGGANASATLSDLERVLVLADRSKAQAVLQIGDLEYQMPTAFNIDHESSEGLGARYVVFDQATTAVREVGPDQYDRAEADFRWRFVAPVFVFTAKLIDVSDGTILASYQFRSELAKSLHRPYRAVLVIPSREIRTTSWDWFEKEWADDARAAVISQIFEEIGKTLVKGGLR